MPTSFGFYHDAALTQPIITGNTVTATQETSGALGPVDKIIYLGSTVAGMKAQATSSPGVDPIVISIVDADAGGGDPASEVKLALSSGGLATATGGASLSLSHTVNSGVANAVPIHVRRTSALTVADVYTDLTLKTNNLDETPV